jgi:hypothetical protein
MILLRASPRVTSENFAVIRSWDGTVPLISMGMLFAKMFSTSLSGTSTTCRLTVLSFFVLVS